MNTNSRWAVMVVGMHRSGTSAVANAVSLLGAQLPLRLMPPSESNAAGHFEPQVIVGLHEEVLAEVGRPWWDWRPLPDAAFESVEIARLSDLLLAAFHDDFGDVPIALIKDPRLCRLLPLWATLLERLDCEPYCVMPYRSPIEVVRSLAERNALAAADGYRLWMRYLLDAELATRGHRRIFVQYQELLGALNPTVYRLVTHSPVLLPRTLAQALPDIQQVVRPELRHHAISDADLTGLAEVPQPVREVYECYAGLRADPGDVRIWNRLDQLRAEFDAVTAAAEPPTEPALPQ